MNKTLFGKQEKMFDEVDKKSFDIDQDRVEKLKKLFPNIVSDGKVDWKALKLLLGENVTEDEERYRFTWNGKSKAIRETSIPTSSTLRPDKESSKNWDETENLYIEGDNLEVLKALQNSYNGKIKMIYIDPPYNTGNDFIYEDNFTISAVEAEKQEGLKDRKGATQTVDRLTKNSKDSAKYHTNWLNMMYPRLSIARDLLTDDGVLCVSIDDNEVTNLSKVCNEIFGESNFIAKLAVQLNPRGRNLDKFVAKTYEYVLIYGKDTSKNTTMFGIEKTGDMVKEYNKEDSVGKYRLTGLRNRNQSFNPLTRPNLYYPLYVNPLTLEVRSQKDGVFTEETLPITSEGVKTCWTWGKEKVKKESKLLIAEKLGDEWRVYRKDYLHGEDGKMATTLIKSLWIDKEINNDYGKKFIKNLFGASVMDFPKSPYLIKKLIKACSKEKDTILDFFSGSATTADAVLSLNNEGKEKRKFIMVQLPEESSEKSIAFKEGYKNICEIGKIRIDKAGQQILTDNPDKDLSNLDIGFKTFKIDSSNFNEWDVSYEAMMKSVKESSEGQFTTYKTDRSHLDLVYEIMLKEGLQLTELVEEIEIGADTIYKIADGIMYVFLGKLNNEVIESIVEMKKEAQELFGLDNPSVVLNETYLDTEIKSNAKKNFEANGIIDIKTL